MKKGVKNEAWSARFIKENAKELVEFNASLGFDKRLYKQDIKGSKAHAAMLLKAGILTSEEEKAINSGLVKLEKSMDEGSFEFKLENEDIHMAVESALGELIGKDIAGRLHTARSRNDQVATDFKLFVREALEELLFILKNLIYTLISLAKEHKNSIMPSFTHLQHAQPISFAFYILSYAFSFKRDLQRLKNSKDLAQDCPLGACALAGTSYKSDRDFTAKVLGFKEPMANAMDAVSDRDFVLDGLYDISVIMLHCSRLCEDLIIYSSQEFAYVSLSDEYSTGSSIMPQKKNPDSLELIRGKSGRCFGNLQALLVTLKGLSMAYNKDMQEDKEGFFDSFDTARLSLKVLNGTLKSMKINKENMENACKSGHLLATDLADYLVQKKNIPFRKAHFIVGSLVAKAEAKGVDISELGDLSLHDLHFGKDANEYLNLEHSLAFKQSKGSSSLKSVEEQITILEDFLKTFS